MSPFILEHNDKEVQNPVARVILIPVFVGAWFIMAAFGLLAAALSAAIGVFFHPILRMLGRKGFVDVDQESNTVKINVDREGFRKD